MNLGASPRQNGMSRVRAWVWSAWLLGMSMPVLAQSYVATDLGRFEGVFSYATGINASGQVIGHNQSGLVTHAFFTGPNGQGMTALGTLPGDVWSMATGINASGQIAGYSLTGERPGGANYERHSFITDAQGRALTTVLSPMGSTITTVTSINSSGQVGGTDNNNRAFITQANGQNAKFIIFDVDARQKSSVAAINDAGQAVGSFVGLTNASERSYVTGPNGMGVTVLPNLPKGVSGGATGINNAGQVVGWNLLSGVGGGQGYHTGANAQGLFAQGSLAGYGGNGASDINSWGQMVGTASNYRYPSFIMVATLIRGHGQAAVDLNTLVDLPDGVVLMSADGINDLGQIVATSTTGSIYLLSPVPEPGRLMLFALGLTLMGALVRSRRQV